VVDANVIQGDMMTENTLLQSEINNLRTRVKALQETVDRLTTRNIQLLVERDALKIGSTSGMKQIKRPFMALSDVLYLANIKQLICQDYFIVTSCTS
jgi:hypothetical protein